MKKYLAIIFSLVFILISIVVVNYSKAIETGTSQSSGYAKVSTNTAYLYKSSLADESFFNKYFLLEKTYFVKILENVDEIFYKVEYNGLIGYVKKENLELVEEVPDNPFLENITFDIYSGSDVILRSEPSTNGGVGSVIYTLPKNSKDLIYIGKISGEESLSGLGNLWYYTKYTFDNKEIFGYIYAPFTVNLSPINENNENLTVVNAKNYLPLNNLLYLNVSTKALIIIVITLPSLLLIYLFIKPSKILKE